MFSKKKYLLLVCFVTDGSVAYACIYVFVVCNKLSISVLSGGLFGWLTLYP